MRSLPVPFDGYDNRLKTDEELQHSYGHTCPECEANYEEIKSVVSVSFTPRDADELIEIYGKEILAETFRLKEAEMRTYVFEGYNMKREISLWKRWMSALYPERFPKGKGHVDIDQAKIVHVEDYLSSQGIEPQRRSQKQWYYLCPLHNEKTASFILYKDDNHWHCYGCNRGHSVIDLCMEMENLKFIDACRRLLTL